MFAINYIADASYRILHAGLTIRRRTILPRIKDAIRILEEDDRNILQRMFDANEFDILSERSFNFVSLPKERQILLGCDSIELTRLF